MIPIQHKAALLFSCSLTSIPGRKYNFHDVVSNIFGIDEGVGCKMIGGAYISKIHSQLSDNCYAYDAKVFDFNKMVEKCI